MTACSSSKAMARFAVSAMATQRGIKPRLAISNGTIHTAVASINRQCQRKRRTPIISG